MMEVEVPLFRIRTGKSVAFRFKPKPVPQERTSPSTSGAKSLALGHRLVKAVERGEARDFTELALMLRVTQARVSQLVALTFLAPDLQEEVLEGARHRPPDHSPLAAGGPASGVGKSAELLERIPRCR